MENGKTSPRRSLSSIGGVGLVEVAPISSALDLDLEMALIAGDA
jgi:hypothetical protein